MKFFLPLVFFPLFLLPSLARSQDSLSLARSLWNEGRIFPARQYLEAYLRKDSLHPEANLLLGYTEFWTGRLPKARKRMETLLAVVPGYSPAAGLLSEINALSAPWLGLRTGFTSDDQPVKTFGTKLETGQYISWLFHPVFHFEYTRFGLSGEALPVFQAGLSNHIFFLRTKTLLSVSAGILAPLSGGHPSKLTGGMSLTQALPWHFSLDAGLQQRPYFYTVRSIQMPISETFTQIALRFDHSGNWLGKAAWERQVFQDDNEVATAYIWVLAPVLNRRAVKVQVGYSCSHADAEESRFRPAQAYDPLIPDTVFVPGVYDPYFTPASQQVHAVLGAIQYSPGSKWRFSAKVNAGIWAEADVPYFYPDRDAFGQVDYFRDFSRERYTPLEIGGEIRMGIGKNTAISVLYNYQKLLFYTLHTGALQIKHQFLP